MRYPAIIEGGGKDYGVWFPDIDGIAAMGYTIDEALANASDAAKRLRDRDGER